MLVHIVYLPTADKTGPDLDRIGKVEEVPDELGRLMLDGGEARKPTDEEVAAYHAERDSVEVPPASEAPTAERSTVDAPKTNGRRGNGGSTNVTTEPPDGTAPAL